jgi:hypothetical protein
VDKDIEFVQNVSCPVNGVLGLITGIGVIKMMKPG